MPPREGNKMEEKTAITLYPEDIEALLKLPDDAFSHITTALLKKTIGLDIPEFHDPMEEVIYKLIAAHMDE